MIFIIFGFLAVSFHLYLSTKKMNECLTLLNFYVSLSILFAFVSIFEVFMPFLSFPLIKIAIISLLAFDRYNLSNTIADQIIMRLEQIHPPLFESVLSFGDKKTIKVVLLKIESLINAFSQRYNEIFNML